MARSASDATRFTSTGPHASAKPSFTSSSINVKSPAPAGESPQQKVARLRAAAAQARVGHEATFDRVVRVGRKWADRAHRATALGLIGLTVVSGIFASFAIGDMLIHNRRKRTEWLADQQAQHATKLNEARLAESTGSLNEDQILLLNRERAADEAAAEKAARKGIFTRAKESVFGGLSKEEVPGGTIGAAARMAQSDVQEGAKAGEGLGIMKAVEEHRRTGEQVEEALHAGGGVLDRQAAADVAAVGQASKGWTSWLTGR